MVRKRNPNPRPSRPINPSAVDGSPPAEQPMVESLTESAAVKAECEKALTSLRRGNHTKALRLMKEACQRYESSALVLRVNSTISFKVASLMDDQNTKSRHMRSAIDSARRAVVLSRTRLSLLTSMRTSCTRPPMMALLMMRLFRV
ncbi:hypothetical protein HPP92_023190 [Vanilla planifolia]|uniref:DUF627 domain-containing protein n=1 Tax=Vanilla planifolia TaxID=51239 RepID=A0A835Q239_VANPL|nr:hypothetical protein HPP92_023190 [Vanilla planifolia]